MAGYTIKELENLSGIKAHTLRIWEQRFNFLKPNRTDTKIRRYSDEELKLVLNIALLTRHGYKISQISQMGKAELWEAILSLENAEAQQERIISELIQHMVDMDIDAMEQVLDTFILSRGVEKTILQVIFPFLEKVGIMWCTSRIVPAQEHLVSNLVRQKLIVGIDTIHSIRRKNKSVILFLPEGEYHEIGLLFISFLLKSRGVQIIYIGADISMSDVAFVAETKKPDFLYCHLSSGKKFKMDKFLNSIYQHFSSQPVIISGSLVATYDKKIKKPVRLLKTSEEIVEFLESL